MADDEDNDFTGAGARLAIVKAAALESIKNATVSEEDVLCIFDNTTKKKTPAGTKKTNGKKPSPPKIQKLSDKRQHGSMEVISDDNSEDEEEAISVSSDDEVTEEIVEAVQRRTRKENRNRVNHFRMKELDQSFNEGQKIDAYLDSVRQQEFEARQREDLLDEVSEEDMNPEVRIKVRWNCGIVYKFTIRKLQSFETIFNDIAAKEKVALENIILEFGEDSKRISPDDTPDGLGVTIAHIIEGCSLKQNIATQSRAPETSGLIEIKVQMVDRRATKLSIHVKPNDKLSKLYCLVSEKMGIEMEKLRLDLDGDVVDHSQTAADLDLEGGEVMDCRVLA